MLKALVAAAAAWPLSRLAVGASPFPQLRWGCNLSSLFFPPRAGAHGEAKRDPTVAPPPGQRMVTGHVLVLLPPPDECAFDRGGGWCLATASPAVVEWPLWLQRSELSLTMIWLRRGWSGPPSHAF
jgi:hypothetical protein